MRLFQRALLVCMCIVFFSMVYVIYVAEDGAGMILWAVEATGFVPGQLLVGIGIGVVLATPFTWVLGGGLTAFLWTAIGIPLGLALVLVGFLKSIF